MNKKFQYTSNQAAGKYGVQAVSEKSFTRYEKQSNTGFYLFIAAVVSMGAWAATIIF